VAPSIRKKLTLASLTSGGRSVGIVRFWTEAMEFFFMSQLFKAQFIIVSFCIYVAYKNDPRVIYWLQEVINLSNECE
jgi:hypothetical protein